MTKLVLYHGTDCEIERIELGKSLPRRDFGVGFYMTRNKTQAENWAKSKKSRKASQYAILYVYEAEPDDEIRIKLFESMTEEWLEMIRRNRLLDGVQHPYDIVIGPEADDNSWAFLKAYIQGERSAKETLEQLSASEKRDQVSFHTERALRCLRLVGKYYLD